MAEWLKAAVLKTVKGESSSRVRIPLSPQNETSASERGEVSRAEGAAESKRARRVATNWKGVAAAQTEKALGNLSLVLIPKTI